MLQGMLIGFHDDSLSSYSLGLLTGTRRSEAQHLHGLQTFARQTPDPQATASSGTYSCLVDGRGTTLGIHTQNTFKLNEDSGDHVRRDAFLREGTPLSPLCWDYKR